MSSFKIPENTSQTSKLDEYIERAKKQYTKSKDDIMTKIQEKFPKIEEGYTVKIYINDRENSMCNVVEDDIIKELGLKGYTATKIKELRDDGYIGTFYYLKIKK